MSVLATGVTDHDLLGTISSEMTSLAAGPAVRRWLGWAVSSHVASLVTGVALHARLIGTVNCLVAEALAAATLEIEVTILNTAVALELVAIGLGVSAAATSSTLVSDSAVVFAVAECLARGAILNSEDGLLALKTTQHELKLTLATLLGTTLPKARPVEQDDLSKHGTRESDIETVQIAAEASRACAREGDDRECSLGTPRRVDREIADTLLPDTFGQLVGLTCEALAVKHNLQSRDRSLVHAQNVDGARRAVHVDKPLVASEFPE